MNTSFNATVTDMNHNGNDLGAFADCMFHPRDQRMHHHSIRHDGCVRTDDYVNVYSINGMSAGRCVGFYLVTAYVGVAKITYA